MPVNVDNRLLLLLKRTSSKQKKTKYEKQEIGKNGTMRQRNAWMNWKKNLKNDYILQHIHSVSYSCLSDTKS